MCSVLESTPPANACDNSMFHLKSHLCSHPGSSCGVTCRMAGTAATSNDPECDVCACSGLTVPCGSGGGRSAGALGGGGHRGRRRPQGARV